MLLCLMIAAFVAIPTHAAAAAAAAAASADRAPLQYTLVLRVGAGQRDKLHKIATEISNPSSLLYGQSVQRAVSLTFYTQLDRAPLTILLAFRPANTAGSRAALYLCRSETNVLQTKYN